MQNGDPAREAVSSPDEFPISVIMERRPVLDNPWIDHQWAAVAVAVGSRDDSASSGQIYTHLGVLRELHPTMPIRLYVDECESYYHNLLSPRPCCYVVTRREAEEAPIPLLVSISFDEAHAYLEGGDEVHPVDMPPELYRWTETFVLHHYVPIKKRKRRRQKWSPERERS